MKKQRTIKIGAISDTHGNNALLKKAIEEKKQGDFFIHAGDFTWYNKKDQFQQFVSLLPQLNYKHKIVIPGNHEILLDGNFTEKDRKQLGYFYVHPEMTREKQINRLKEHCTYLQHDFLEIDGIKFFCSSYSNIPPYYRTAFQISEKEIEDAWDGVPAEIDVLITHPPPYQILDRAIVENGEYEHVGMKAINNYLSKTKAKVHIFGHIHESKGKMVKDGIRFYNVAEKFEQIQLIIEE